MPRAHHVYNLMDTAHGVHAPRAAPGAGACGAGGWYGFVPVPCPTRNTQHASDGEIPPEEQQLCR